MKVVIYRARGKDGYLFDLTFDPHVDFEILKRTRNIEKMEILTPEIPLDVGEGILKSIYGTSSMIARMISSQKYLVNNVIKKYNIEKVSISVTKGYMPGSKDISRIEEYIKGRIITLNKLEVIGMGMGISERELISIVQALYCERRIKIAASMGSIIKSKRFCEVCGKKTCTEYKAEDNDGVVLLYAADNYGVKVPGDINLKSYKLYDAQQRAQEDFIGCIRSKKSFTTLWCSPNSYDYGIISPGMAEVLKEGGRILYITSNSLIYEARKCFEAIFQGCSVDIYSDLESSYKNPDVTICAYNNYPVFYKAFDVVFLDQRYAYIDRPSMDILCLCQRGVKEGGKFVNITCCPEPGRRGIFKGSSETISVPVGHTKSPIPEPRIVTSRYLKGAEIYLPEMAMDIIRWSMVEDSRVIIFVPDDIAIHKIYYYLTNMEGIERDAIEISDPEDKTPVIKFRKREIKILISMDFKDAAYIMDDINIIVMHSDEDIFHVDTLINIAAMAAVQTRKKLREVVFVATQENETLSLAKSTIRNINRIAWEKGYIKI